MEGREGPFQENLNDRFMTYVKEDRKPTEGVRQTLKLTDNLKVHPSFHIY